MKKPRTELQKFTWVRGRVKGDITHIQNKVKQLMTLNCTTFYERDRFNAILTETNTLLRDWKRNHHIVKSFVERYEKNRSYSCR